MVSRSEFHGNIGQVVVGTLYAEPRSKQIYSIGLPSNQEEDSETMQGTILDNGGKGPRWSGGLKMIIGIHLATLVLMGVIVLLTRQAPALDINIFCFTGGARHSVGTVVRMADTAYRECVKLGETIPEWRPVSSHPF